MLAVDKSDVQVAAVGLDQAARRVSASACKILLLTLTFLFCPVQFCFSLEHCSYYYFIAAFISSVASAEPMSSEGECNIEHKREFG